jgi:beta-mannosidase
MKIRNLFFIAALLTLFSCSEKHNNPLIQELNDSWNVTTDTLNINMEVDVPSVIIADMYEKGLIPHPYYGNVEPQLQWIPQREWVYTLNFDAEDGIMNEDVVELVFDGLDTYADVWLNDKHLFYADNMFKKWTCDVEDILKEKDNNIKIKFYPFDKVRDSLIETYPLRFPEKYAVMRKSAYQNGWDWAPRYMNMGIWQPVYLKAWTRSTMNSATIITTAIQEK